jgi:hypothetical protein
MKEADQLPKGYIIERMKSAHDNNFVINTSKSKVQFSLCLIEHALCHEDTWSLLHVDFFLDSFFHPEDGGKNFVRNVCWLIGLHRVISHKDKAFQAQASSSLNFYASFAIL